MTCHALPDAKPVCKKSHEEQILIKDPLSRRGMLALLAASALAAPASSGSSTS